MTASAPDRRRRRPALWPAALVVVVLTAISVWFLLDPTQLPGWPLIGKVCLAVVLVLLGVGLFIGDYQQRSKP